MKTYTMKIVEVIRRLQKGKGKEHFKAIPCWRKLLKGGEKRGYEWARTDDKRRRMLTVLHIVLSHRQRAKRRKTEENEKEGRLPKLPEGTGRKEEKAIEAFGKSIRLFPEWIRSTEKERNKLGQEPF